ncbi:hypothetical protein MLD38_037099 [Melastoma candidum]|uniref:Uncharacterized protein n=1 Tax=Melastoma candidum TaxID=119954 RepID=A0ACB9LMG8_9MYRT|nr:hypothetical protein MLD38_037099 [Melastoma candidum]
MPPPTAILLVSLFLLISVAASAGVTPAPHIVSPTSSPVPPTSEPPTASPSPTTSPAAPSNASAPRPRAPAASSAPLDPKQLAALESLDLIPTTHNPCIQPSFHNATVCDGDSPFRHLIALRLSNCSDTVTATLSSAALKDLLTTLETLSFQDCPSLALPPHFLPPASSALTTFTAVSSLRRISSGFLSRLTNLTELTVSNTPVNASGAFIILGNLKKIQSFTLSNANLTGLLPRHWHPNITHIDLSGNQIKGMIPGSVTLLGNLQTLDLSSNSLDGEIPVEIGDLITLKNLSLRGNSLSGGVPDTLAAVPGLLSVDLSSNQLNGTVPGFFTKMKHLKYLNLERNNFHGVMPFNETFIRGLEVFKIGENSNLCYNHSGFISKTVRLGIAPCDKHGLPMTPPPSRDNSPSPDDGTSSDYSDGDSSDSPSKGNKHHGPNKVVLGVAIALCSIVFLILFLILMSRCCK